jgi:hypothetical protein
MCHTCGKGGCLHAATAGGAGTSWSAPSCRISIERCCSLPLVCMEMPVTNGYIAHAVVVGRHATEPYTGPTQGWTAINWCECTMGQP